MDKYELYCLVDPCFYDNLEHSTATDADFPILRRPLPAGWSSARTDTWCYFAPDSDTPLPAQGWKIHVSARVEDAEKAIETVWDYCMPRGVAFKFLRGLPVLVMVNSKAASRASSGKLVTLYPRDEAQLELVLKELDELLRDVRGPYILSDLRYNEGPLFVRYGGFAERHCLSLTGERVLALEDGDGRLVPDVRGATFSVPPWTTLPAFLEPQLAARNAVTTTGLPYTIESVLHFSNGGGVYLGRDKRTGERVVLKEARPHAGLDAAGRDAVARIEHERDILERLSGLPAAPALRGYFTLGEHHFLVQEFVDGTPLQRRLVHRYPLTRATCTERDLAEYTEWAVRTLEEVTRAVGSLHERGVVFGDLHPDNILLTDEGRVALIDYEVATLAEDRARAALAHPAFAAPADRQGVDVDRYALACLRLGLFAPQCTIMLPLHRPKVVHLGEIVKETFPVPASMIDGAVATIAGGERDTAAVPMPGVASWPELRNAMATAITAAATPGRDDRLFPGDVAQFQPGGGLNLAHGAAGVLFALHSAGLGPYPEYESWLRERARRPVQGSGLGLYDGLHGIAYVLDLLGHHEDAHDLVEICLREKWDRLESALISGLSGIGLNLLHFGHTDLALRAVDICAGRLDTPVPEISGGTNPRAGLMHGSSGPALLFLRAYEQTGDPALLDLAATALRQDLRRCRHSEDGSLQVNQGWRLLPYLDEGSAGIALVLERYLRYRHDEAFGTALAELRLAGRAGFFVQAGLFTGRAGIIAAGAGDVPELVKGLRWHALPYAGGLAFPGDQLLRLSMDFATGTAGVLFALASALGDGPCHLPFLEAAPERPLPDDTTEGGVRHGSSRPAGS
ncbi:Lanthionine biosynthesis protein LanL [[Actinomadura] parvosata subsp. kistnae]|uniref:non-specific serine/threonine protein kinase n=1 Tax=[Actinomadura] parvosata subsp. kistnae TaxID=1909395 RepID=A0A1U9ZRM3_9ACTN|nr:class III lanthionine synthetase LanKC [Nonomuraea sp. ATCC 55076]AQZ60592.1 serine/threonine protein kinase [Nonomuraea sp. ATCC 55076]SPL90830.1 Lanthionine biosynthesis protein LanL [Actinomadura parvosata subsp. kistnae]